MKTNGVAKSYFFLFFTAILWGFAFAAQRLGGKTLGAFSFNAIRFFVGALSLVPLFFVLKDASITKQNFKQTLRSGMLCGLVLFFGSSFQQLGMIWTEAGKAAFLTGLYIIFIPLLGLLFGKKQGKGLIIGSILAVIGLYLLSVKEHFSISLGDGLVIISAVFWSIHILVLGYYSTKQHPLQIALIQNISCALLSLVVALCAEKFSFTTIKLAFSLGPQGSLLPVLYAGVCSIGIAYTLQIFGQQKVKAGHAALILSLEAVFASIGGWIILNETMDKRALLGASLMLAGMLVAQLMPTHKKN